jgi:hypothetical protein
VLTQICFGVFDLGRSPWAFSRGGTSVAVVAAAVMLALARSARPRRCRAATWARCSCSRRWRDAQPMLFLEGLHRSAAVSPACS